MAKDSEPEYEIEDVIGHNMVKGKLFYDVTWIGYPGEVTALPEKELANAAGLLKKYKKEHGLDSSAQPKGKSTPKKKKKRTVVQEEDDDDEEEEEAYEVENILSHRKVRGQTKYTVSWVGYPGEKTELPESELEHAHELLKAYKEANGLSSRQTRSPSKRTRTPKKAHSSSPVATTTPSKRARRGASGSPAKSPATSATPRGGRAHKQLKLDKDMGCANGEKIQALKNYTTEFNEPAVLVTYVKGKKSKPWTDEFVPTRLVLLYAPEMLQKVYEDTIADISGKTV